LALLNSVVNGSNYERTSWFSFKDPYLANATFTRSAVPILYGASLAVLGCDYADIVTLVSFLNTLATAGTFFYFSPQWFGRGRMVMMLVFLIGGSGPLSRALRRTTDILETDLGPHIPLIAQLSFSLEASFSIPLAVFALTLAQCTGESSLRRSAKSFYVAAGIAAACIPSLAAGTAFFITVSNYAHCALMMMPFALSVIPKAIGSCLVIYPVWREYQVRGVFFAQIVAFFDTIGIPYLAIFLVAWFVNEPVFFHRMLSSIVAFIATCFVRQGMDHIENDIAVTGVVLPMVIVLFMKCLNRLRDRAPSRQTRGVADVLYALVIGYVLVSGIAYLVKIATTRAPGFDDNAVDFGLEVRKVVPSHKIVFNDRRSPNPVSLFAGRQVLFGKAEDVWRRGCDIRVPAMAYDRVVFDGRGAEVMRLFGIDYLAEYRRRPFILKNVTQWQYFDVLVQNDDWLLLKLIPEALAGVTYP
jgi:hypothetical protein